MTLSSLWHHCLLIQVKAGVWMLQLKFIQLHSFIIINNLNIHYTLCIYRENWILQYIFCHKPCQNLILFNSKTCLISFPKGMTIRKINAWYLIKFGFKIFAKNWELNSWSATISNCLVHLLYVEEHAEGR